MSFADWAEQGRKLGLLGRTVGWWIGDWLFHGNAAYGERYVRAARITGYDVQTLMNMVYVASRVDPSRRREKLSWSHHGEVAALDKEEQERWLEFAERERLSVRDLRQAIRDKRRACKTSENEATALASSSAVATEESFVCPSCGHHFKPSRGEVLASAV